jgi:type IV pilus assembly protein PilA
MIVVVIIGLLAAMAIPAFQKVRTSSLEKTVLNDGRQIGAAVQQYCMEYAVTQAPALTYVKASGAFTGSDANFLAYLKGISKNYSDAFGAVVPADTTNSFTLTLPGAFGNKSAVFSGEGKMITTQ